MLKLLLSLALLCTIPVVAQDANHIALYFDGDINAKHHYVNGIAYYANSQHRDNSTVTSSMTCVYDKTGALLYCYTPMHGSATVLHIGEMVYLPINNKLYSLVMVNNRPKLVPLKGPLYAHRRARRAHIRR